MPAPTDRPYLIAALAGGAGGLGLGAAAGVWWGRRIPGHIFRDGEDWYVDEPVLRELQRRLHWSGLRGGALPSARAIARLLAPRRRRSTTCAARSSALRTTLGRLLFVMLVMPPASAARRSTACSGAPTAPARARAGCRARRYPPRPGPARRRDDRAFDRSADAVRAALLASVRGTKPSSPRTATVRQDCAVASSAGSLVGRRREPGLDQRLRLPRRQPAALHRGRDLALVAARQPGQLAAGRRVDEPEAKVGLQLSRQRLRERDTPIHPALVVTHQPADHGLREAVILPPLPPPPPTLYRRQADQRYRSPQAAPVSFATAAAARARRAEPPRGPLGVSVAPAGCAVASGTPPTSSAMALSVSAQTSHGTPYTGVLAGGWSCPAVADPRPGSELRMDPPAVDPPHRHQPVAVRWLRWIRSPPRGGSDPRRRISPSP